MNKMLEMEVFVQVVNAGSLAIAARRLRRNPSSVSKLLGELEYRLGVALLTGTTRSITLTDAGEVFFHDCKAILTDIDKAEEAATERYVELCGRLRVAGMDACSPNIILPLMEGFVSRFPGIQIDIEQAEYGQKIDYEKTDVALRIGEVTTKGLKCVKLAPSRLLICASPQYLASHGTPQSLVNLADHNCIGFSTKSQFNPWELCYDRQTEKLQLTGSLIANNAELIRQAALSGWGICQLSNFIIGPDVQEGRLVELLPKQPDKTIIYVCAIFPSQKSTSDKIQAFVSYLKEQLSMSQFG